MSAHRHSWAHSNATGASPAHTKCSESPTAHRSRDYLIRGEINLVLSRPNKQPTGRKKKQARHPWFFPAQPRDWLLFRHVRSGITALKSVSDSRECYHCTEVSRGTVIDTSTNPGCRDWMEKSQTPFLQAIYHTQSLSATPQSCPSSISFSTWSCRFLGPKGFSLPPSQAGPSLSCHTNSSMWPVSPWGAARVHELKPHPSPAACPGSGASEQPSTSSRDSPGCFLGAMGSRMSDRAVWAMQPHG